MSGWGVLVAVVCVLAVCTVLVAIMCIVADRNPWVEEYRATECTTCGRPLPLGGWPCHTIRARYVDDHHLAGALAPGEGTGMSADYCRRHCPGGCDRGCARLAP